MPTVDAAKIKIRRGRNVDRKKIILDEGELGYTIDTKRLYVGDGQTTGGNSATVKNFLVGNRTSTTIASNAEIGDIVFDNNIVYSLSGSDPFNTSNWLNLGPRVDNTTISYNSNNQLQVITARTNFNPGEIGAGLSLDADGVLNVTLASDSATLSLLSFNSSNKLVVGTINNNSHGVLGYQTTSFEQHHSSATSSAAGFMSASDKVKLDAAISCPIDNESDANCITNGINNFASVKILASKIEGQIAANSALYTNTLRRQTGSLSTSLSGNQAVDPYYSLNNDVFAGTIINSALTNNSVSNEGLYCNIKLTNFLKNGTTGYQNKMFLLPGGNGINYAIFIKNPASDVEYNNFVSSFPYLETISVDFNSNSTILLNSVITAINNITDNLTVNMFEAWSANDNLYIHVLVKNRTPSYVTTYATLNNNTTYKISDSGLSYSNAGNIEGNSGSGITAGSESNGRISASFNNFLVLQYAAAYTLPIAGRKSIHKIKTFPNGTQLSDGKYFLLYDTLGNRICVWYNVTGSGTAPNLANGGYRGISTEFVEVNISGYSSTTSDSIANGTMLALNNNSYFNTVYEVSYDVSSTPDVMTFTSLNEGYTDGLVNRIGLGFGTVSTFLSNETSGSPKLSKLYGSIFNDFQQAPGPNQYPLSNINIPAKVRVVDSDGTALFRYTDVANDAYSAIDNPLQSSMIQTVSLLKY